LENVESKTEQRHVKRFRETQQEQNTTNEKIKGLEAGLHPREGQIWKIKDGALVPCKGGCDTTSPATQEKRGANLRKMQLGALYLFDWGERDVGGGYDGVVWQN